MRILIVNWNRRKIAGIEDYLLNVVPAFHRDGHDLAFAYEVDDPESREAIPMPDGAPTWDLSQAGLREVLVAMENWRPDIIYAHGMLEPTFEAGFLKIAPAVYFTHNYYGTCISGIKTFKFPTVRPCDRRFGSACLLHYFPRRCGGLNPLTMWRLFRRESERLKNLAKYRAIVTHSSHMKQEYVRQGFPEQRVHNFVYEIAKPRHQPRLSQTAEVSMNHRKRRPWNLLFVGRMDPLKGGSVLIDALPIVSKRLDTSVRVVFAGDGPEMNSWQKRARRAQKHNADLDFHFAGWVDKSRLEQLYGESDLLVVPSLWPEPFGRIGPEAGLRGVPVAAFQVGGVSDWLVDGVNGYLAPGEPPTVSGLAEAIVKCLESPENYAELRKGAVITAEQFNLAHHLDALYGVFEQVLSQTRTN